MKIVNLKLSSFITVQYHYLFIVPIAIKVELHEDFALATCDILKISAFGYGETMHRAINNMSESFGSQYQLLAMKQDDSLIQFSKIIKQIKPRKLN